MRILHVIESMSPEEGGPPRVVAGLSTAQRRMGLHVDILCGGHADSDAHNHFWRLNVAGFDRGSVHVSGPHSRTLFERTMALRRYLTANVARYDVVHIHQLWRLIPTLTAAACRRLRIPYLIAPHTSLSPWALSQKRAKKLLARRLIWDRNFRGATGFHALNALEAQEIRTEFFKRAPPVYVVPNGVFLEEFDGAAVGYQSAFINDLQRYASGYILFLARLHVMKGPDLLLEAFAIAARQYPDLHLLFAGPDYGMLSALRARTTQLNLTSRVHFLGMVSGGDRLWILRNALCLSQPSRDEGFSLSILEAMASRRPVVISEHCKFPEVAQQRAGIVVPLAISALAEGLSDYAGNIERRERDGHAARALVEREYTWDSAAAKTATMYMSATRSFAAVPRQQGLPP